MTITKKQEEVRFGDPVYIGPRYYDYPDGEDLVGKLAFTTKWSFVFGTFVGLVNSYLPPVPTTTKGKIVRVMAVSLPCVGMAATFTCVTYYATVLRKKDDAINYILGGVAAGAILGPLTGPNFAGWTAFYCAIIGAGKKSLQMEGKKFVPEIKREGWNTYTMRKFDTSLLKERKGNWTKELPENV